MIVDLEGIMASYISLEDLLVNKKASGRLIDKSDVKDLQQQTKNKKNKK